MRLRPMFLILVTLCAALWRPVSSDAQALTGYQLRLYLAGGAAPLSTYDLQASAVTCGQPKTTVTGTATNPRVVAWDDPANPALDCRWTDPGTGPLLALPFSPTTTYTAAIVAINAAGASPESARSNPFTRPGATPAAPANLRVSP